MAKKKKSKKSSAKKSDPKKRTCKVCNGSGPECFYYLHKRYKYDVDRAREITSDGRKPVELDPESVQYSVDNCSIHANHVPHVDTAYPGIIAHLQYVTDEGERVRAHLLIDGNHRAARCLQLGKPYYVYILSEAETKAILVRSPCEFKVSKRTRNGRRRRDKVTTSA